MKENQKGFTLVELIVVMAIMGVVATMGLLSFSLVTGQNVKSCASDLESYLAQTKMQAVSKASADLTISVKPDGVYANLSVEGRDVKVGKTGIDISYSTSDGREITLTGTESLTLSFDRSSGAFLELPDHTYCTGIFVRGAGRTLKITLVPQTGKYYTEVVSGP